MTRSHILILIGVFCVICVRQEVFAQAPALRFNQNWLNISQNDCLARGRQALANIQYQITYQGDWWVASSNQNEKISICFSCLTKASQTQAYVMAAGTGDQRVTELVTYVLNYISNNQGTTTTTTASTYARPTKGTYTTNENITIEFDGFPGYATDWISIGRVGEAVNQSVAYRYIDGNRRGTVTFTPLSAGNYEVRGFFNWQGTSSYDVKSRATFTVSGGTTTTAGTSISWGQSANNFQATDIGKRATYTCPAGGEFANVWGTDVYTHDSSICTAAVHSGLITKQYGGVVSIEILTGQSTYTGTNRNGVNTGNYGAWGLSYRFVR